MSITPEKAQEIFNELEKLKNAVDKIERNFQLHKVRIDSTDEYHFSLVTDAISGFMFKKDGSSALGVPKTSVEVVGRKLDPNGKEPAKMIRAENGDIVLDACHGNIILRGANVHIEGNSALGGQVTINSSKITQIDSPIFNAKTDYTTLAATGAFSASGGSHESNGEFANESTKGTDEEDASFFGRILSAIKKFKKFFESPCG